MIQVEKQGITYPYQLELKSIYPIGSEVFAESTVIKGKSWPEDVQTYFESNDKKVKFNMYRDELDQTTLERNGIETRFDCN